MKHNESDKKIDWKWDLYTWGTYASYVVQT